MSADKLSPTLPPVPLFATAYQKGQRAEQAVGGKQSMTTLNRMIAAPVMAPAGLQPTTQPVQYMADGGEFDFPLVDQTAWIAEREAQKAASVLESALNPMDIDPWESPANVQTGVSTVSGTPFVNPAGQSPAPGVQAAPAFVGEAQARIPEPMQPAYSPVFTEGVFAPPPDNRTSLEKGIGLLDSIVTAPAKAYESLVGGNMQQGDLLKQNPTLVKAQQAAGDIGAGLGSWYDNTIRRGDTFNPLGLPEQGSSADIGRFVGEGMVPTTYAELALAPLLGLTPADDLLKGAVRGGLRGATSYVDNAARAGLGAVPPNAVTRTVAPAAPLRPAGETLYHGTDSAPFSAFDPARIGSATDSGQMGKGFYFSSDPAVQGSKANLLTANVDVQNPLRLSYPAWGSNKEALVNEALGTQGLSGAALSDELTRRGFDGVMLDYSPVGYNQREVMALRPEQAAIQGRGANIPRGISPTEGEGIMRTAGAAEKLPARGEGSKKFWLAPDGKRIDIPAGAEHSAAGDLFTLRQQGYTRVELSPNGIGIEGANPDVVSEIVGKLRGDRAARVWWDVGDYHGTATVDEVLSGRTNLPSPSTAGSEASPAGLTGAASTPPSGRPPSGAAVGGEPEFAANIRLSKYPEEVREIIAQSAADHADEVQAARRGVISDEEVTARARALVEDMGGNWSKTEWVPGTAWNAEEIVAIRGALTDSTRQVMEAADAARMGGLEAQTALAEAILKQQQLQQIVHGVTAEAGRSLRAFRQQADAALGSGDVRRVQELLKQALGTSDQADIAKLSEAVKALDINNPAAVSNFLRNVNKPNFWDKLHYYWINSILSGPVTQARNILGNTSASLYSPIQRLGAAGIEQPLAAIQGRQAQRFWQEAPASVVGIFQGVPEGVRAALTTAKTGISPRAAAKLDMRPAPIGGTFGTVVGLPTRALGVMDEFFSAINYRSTLNAEAVRMARMEGLRGDALTSRIADLVANPPEPLMNRAVKKADELVFRGDPGDAARWLSQGRQKVPGLRYVMPFLNTPANLLKYGFKNSPIGLLDQSAWRKAIAGNPEGADELANAFMGSAIAASLATAVATGAMDITAAAPVDAAERDRFFREGKMPFSVRIPGVGWVEYKQFPMLDTTFTLVGSAVDGIRRGEDVKAIAAQAAANIATNLLDKSYMSGIGDLFDAVQDPARYAERWVTRQATGFVPFSGATRQTAQAMDQTIRDPKGFEEAFKAQTPFLSKEVPPRLTAFGEESDRGIPSPTRVTTPKQSQVDAELERLGEEVTFVGKLKGASRDEQFAYQQMAGQMHKFLLERVISDDRYAALPDSGKVSVIEDLVTNARGPVRDVLDALRSSEGYQRASDAEKREMLRRAAEKWLAKIEERR